MSHRTEQPEPNQKFWSCIAIAFGLMFVGVVVFTATTGSI